MVLSQVLLKFHKKIISEIVPDNYCYLFTSIIGTVVVGKLLLDYNFTHVLYVFTNMNTGTLIQIMTDKSRTGLGRLGSFSSSFKDGRKETVRMAFLFTNHLLLTTRASNGRLHLAKVSVGAAEPIRQGPKSVDFPYQSGTRTLDNIRS